MQGNTYTSEFVCVCSEDLLLWFNRTQHESVRSTKSFFELQSLSSMELWLNIIQFIWALLKLSGKNPFFQPSIYLPLLLLCTIQHFLSLLIIAVLGGKGGKEIVEVERMQVRRRQRQLTRQAHFFVAGLSDVCFLLVHLKRSKTNARHEVYLQADPDFVPVPLCQPSTSSWLGDLHLSEVPSPRCLGDGGEHMPHRGYTL